MARLILLSVFCLSLLHNIDGQDIFDNFFSESTSCEEHCKSTYSLHTYPKPDHLCSCLRGCRLFSIIDIVEEYTDLNATRDSCTTACKEAYDDKGSQDACALGCSNQKSFIMPFRKTEMELLGPQPVDLSFMYPFLYVHNVYSNMIDKMANSMSVSWTYYTQSDDGRLVVIRSEPRRVIFGNDGDYKTQNYVETNLAANDNSATPNLKHSQQIFETDPHRLSLRDLELDGKDLRSYDDMSQQDWLSCISKKTGISRFLLCLVIIISIVGMIWLCLSTTVTAKEQRICVQPQKLSFYGDLEYLKELDEKGLLKKTSPQAPYIQAAPLPIKIKVETI